MAKYIIKAWETEDEREQGLSDILESNLSDNPCSLSSAFSCFCNYRPFRFGKL